MRSLPTETLLLVWSLTFGAFAGMAQTLTSTFQFTASGYIGTPATATTPFQGQTFTNATITITASGNTANRQTSASGYCLPSDSATVSISGVGTFPFAASAIGNSVEVDPIKGIQGNSPYFASTCAQVFGPIATTIQGSTAWDMLTSFGPFQSNINLYFGYSFPTPTGGDNLVLNPLSPSPSKFQATLTGTPPSPTLIRTGVLSHIVAGGGWTTVITLVNTSSAAVPVTVALRDDYGNALTLPVTTTNQGATQTTRYCFGFRNSKAKCNASDIYRRWRTVYLGWMGRCDEFRVGKWFCNFPLDSAVGFTI